MSETSDRLLNEAERLFAEASIAGVSTREIVEAAGQRNTSAVSYHFGSREGLLLAILARRGLEIDHQRCALRAALENSDGYTSSDSWLADLVRCLVAPYASELQSVGGRHYLRIVAQLRGRFASWRIDSDEATTRCLAQILDEIEQIPSQREAIRRERMVSMIMMMTSAVAERAQVIADGGIPALSHSEFVDNLVTMCTAVLLAPA